MVPKDHESFTGSFIICFLSPCARAYSICDRSFTTIFNSPQPAERTGKLRKNVTKSHTFSTTDVNEMRIEVDKSEGKYFENFQKDNNDTLTVPKIAGPIKVKPIYISETV